jgi:adenosine deaminase
MFHDLFARAVDLGFQCTIHSGEVLGPDSIRKAMALPGVKRLGHGIRCVEDPELMAEIKQRGITLEICPTSNLALLWQYRNPGAASQHRYHDLSHHPLATLLPSGFKLALGADDGPWFRTSISREYRRVAISFGLSLMETLQFTQNGIEAAFVTDAERMALFNTYDQRLATYQAACNELLKKAGASIGGAQIARTLLDGRQK